ncbi:GIY-YIG nuclease family protein [Halovulum sp. GXIMD14794]
MSKSNKRGRWTAPPVDTETVYAGPIHDHWQEAANRHGFSITRRIRDRYHLALRCHGCRRSHASRIYTVTTTRPRCPHCVRDRLERDAEAAGLVHIDRDPQDRHYSRYRAPCGHVIHRQHEIVKRAAAGATGLRCEVCHASVEAEEARTRGWELVGPDPEGDANYRTYQHSCGHVQRIARVNMQTGRFQCGQCGEGWVVAPSYLYLLRFTLANSRDVIKLGYSRDPGSRLAHQLVIDRAMPAELLRTVRVRSGRHALRTERTLHAHLRHRYPEARVDPSCWQGQIRVGSEIYDIAIRPQIDALLDRIETWQRAA